MTDLTALQEALIREVAAGRAAATPALASRCDKAVALLLTGKVHLAGPHHALVDSYKDPGMSYSVNATCACPDALNKAPEGWCSHKLAVEFARACPPPLAAPAACPEALFTITLKGTMDGRDTLLTARGQTWVEFTANVQRLKGLLDTVPARPAATPPPPAAAAATPEGWCLRHGVQMDLQTNVRGSWRSHRLPGGGFCKGT